MEKKMFNRVVSTLFVLIAAAHAVRLLFEWEVTVGGFAVPLWASVIVVVVFALLALANEAKKEVVITKKVVKKINRKVKK